QGLTPRVHPDAYVDPQAAVIGDVTIDAGASVWPFTVLRGDQDNYVRLGKNSNVQDNSVLHVTPQHPCIVGDNVTIGHRAVVHACTIMDNCRVGIRAVVLNGAVVEEGAQVGAGGLRTPPNAARRPLRTASPTRMDAACGPIRARKSLSRLWVRQISAHSAAALPAPRKENRRKPRPSLVWPKTGSTIALRRP